MTYELESDIPIPAGYGRGPNGKYPFRTMKKGDSFFVPATETCAKNLGTAAYCWSKSNKSDAKFTVRTVKNPDGVRCWRIS